MMNDYDNDRNDDDDDVDDELNTNTVSNAINTCVFLFFFSRSVVIYPNECETVSMPRPLSDERRLLYYACMYCTHIYLPFECSK